MAGEIQQLVGIGQQAVELLRELVDRMKALESAVQAGGGGGGGGGGEALGGGGGGGGGGVAGSLGGALQGAAGLAGAVAATRLGSQLIGAAGNTFATGGGLQALQGNLLSGALEAAGSVTGLSGVTDQILGPKEQAAAELSAQVRSLSAGGVTLTDEQLSSRATILLDRAQRQQEQGNRAANAVSELFAQRQGRNASIASTAAEAALELGVLGEAGKQLADVFRNLRTVAEQAARSF